MFQNLEPLTFIYNIQSILLPCVISQSLSSICRCGSDWGMCRPEAAGHGGTEEAKGERAGESGRTAEAVHSQEPVDWLRVTVSLSLFAVKRSQNLFMYVIYVSSLALFTLSSLASLNCLLDFCRESWKVWGTLNTSFTLFRLRWMKTPPRSFHQQCESLILLVIFLLLKWYFIAVVFFSQNIYEWKWPLYQCYHV